MFYFRPKRYAFIPRTQTTTLYFHRSHLEKDFPSVKFASRLVKSRTMRGSSLFSVRFGRGATFNHILHGTGAFNFGSKIGSIAAYPWGQFFFPLITTVTCDRSNDPIRVGGTGDDVMPKVNAVLDHMKDFTNKVVSKEWKVITIFISY